MAQVIDQYAIRIGFQLNSAQMASVQRMVNGFVGGLNGRVIPSLGRAVNQIQSTTRQSLAVLDATVARTSKLGMDLTTRLSLPMAAFAGYGINAAAEIEQANLTLEALTGNAATATKGQKELSDYAISTSFSIQNVMENANRLLATSSTTPAGVKSMIELFGALAMGDNEKFSRIAYAFGQIKSAGRLMGTEGRQLSEALVNIYPILEKMRGLKSGSVNSSTISGFNFTPEEVYKAMQILAKEGPFFKIMEKRAGSLSVSLSGLVERFYLFAGAVGESLRKAIGLDGILKGIGKTFERVQKRIERMTDGQKKLLVSVGLFLIAVGPLTYFLSVWMRTGAMLLRMFGAMKLALMGLKAVGVAGKGGFIGMLFGGAGGKAIIAVLAVAAVIAGIYLLIDDLIVWNKGGKSVFGMLFGEREKWRWVDTTLDKLEKSLKLKTTLANAVMGLDNLFKSWDPNKNEGMQAIVKKMNWEARMGDLGRMGPTYSQLTVGQPYLDSTAIINRQNRQPLMLKIPGTPLAQGAADTLARMGILAAPQNSYVTKFDLRQAGASIGVY
jgi:tape measure domain-containing protein